MNRHRITWWAQFAIALMVLVLALAACQGSEPPADDTHLVTEAPVPTSELGEAPDATATVQAEPDAQESPAPDMRSTDPDAQQAIAFAVADLSHQLSVPEESIFVRSVEPVQWPDASLGCPQPGMMYAQVTTPGYLIALEAVGTRYNYHTDRDRIVILCAKERELAPVASAPAQAIEEVGVPTSPTIPTPSSALLQKLVAEAKGDLAKRLDMPTDQIDLVELSPVVWPDGALGCPKPGVAYTQVQQEGLLIRLHAGKRIYPYHSGGGASPFLCEQAIEDVMPQ